MSTVDFDRNAFVGRFVHMPSDNSSSGFFKIECASCNKLIYISVGHLGREDSLWEWHLTHRGESNVVEESTPSLLFLQTGIRSLLDSTLCLIEGFNDEH